jgi:hypothetical protein
MVEAVETTSTPRRARRRRRSPTRRRVILIGVAVAILLLVGAATAIAVQGLKARTTLTAAMPLLSQIERGIRSGDTDQALAAVAELRESTGEARSATSGLHWRLGAYLPWAGPNLRAVSTTAAAIDDVATDVLEPLIVEAENLEFSRLSPVEGRVELAPLAAAEPLLSSAAHSVADARESMHEIDTDRVIWPIGAAVEDVRSRLDELGMLVQTGARAARLLPPMLGADGPRTYLVIFQNTAEMRSTGGMPGSFAIVSADDGQIAMLHQGTARELGLFYAEPVLPLDPAKEEIYTERLGRFFSGVNLAPDFPTAAILAVEMARRAGFEVDGVVATDTVALSYILDATGPIALASGDELTPDNAVSMLLSDVYWEIPDQRDQDEFFAATAATVFEALTRGAGDPMDLIDALADAADERRLLVWSAHEEEQQELHGTVLSGAFDDTAPSPSTLGVFFNDGTSAKMQYYLETEVKHMELICTEDERYDTLQVRLRSTAPPEAVDEFPPDVTGVGNTGVPTGSFRMNVAFYGGESGHIRSVVRDGATVEATDYRDGNRPVRVHTVELAPGDEITFEVQLGQPDRGELVDVWSTPTIGEGGHRATAAACR